MPVFADEANYTSQVAHADELYMAGAYGSSAYTDNQARVTTANATHTAKTNSQFDTLNTVTTTNAAGLVFKTYSGANVITDATPTNMGSRVRTALDADALHDSGGPIPPSAYTSTSPYVDGAWLAEASKQTGEKLF